LFLTLFLFNIGGYYLVFIGVKFHITRDVLQSIDEGSYSTTDEITLTIPLNLPYPIYQNGFARVNGEFEYEGNHYKLVKQKLINDNLVVVCLKDHESNRLDNALTKIERTVNDQQSQSSHTLSLLAKLFKDFQKQELLLTTHIEGWSRKIITADKQCIYEAASRAINIPPPRIS
jgi:hypothetical protein